MKTTKTLRTDLPVEVWDRLEAEAASKGKKIGTYLRDLIVARDEKRQAR